jgi:hypothetical protein
MFSGFLGRSGAETQTLITEDEEAIYNIVNNKEFEVCSMRILQGARFARVDYKPVVEKAVRTGSIILAMLTTAYARIKLYSVLEQYPEQVAYMDTGNRPSMEHFSELNLCAGSRFSLPPSWAWRDWPSYVHGPRTVEG